MQWVYANILSHSFFVELQTDWLGRKEKSGGFILVYSESNDLAPSVSTTSLVFLAVGFSLAVKDEPVRHKAVFLTLC